MINVNIQRDQNVIEEYRKLENLANQAYLLNTTTSRYEHDAFIKEAQDTAAPGSLGMISDEYKFLCRGHGAYQPAGCERITEITRQGDIYFALHYISGGKKGDDWLGNLATQFEVFSDGDIDERVHELVKRFKESHFAIVRSWHKKNGRKRPCFSGFKS